MRTLASAAFLLAAAGLLSTSAAPAAKAPDLQCKYGFKYVVKVVRGHKKRVKVCKAKPRPKPRADLVVTLEPSMKSITAGNRLRYVATLDNLGPATAADVEVSVTFPAGAVLSGVTSVSSSGTEISSLVSCEGSSEEGSSGFTWHCTLTELQPSRAPEEGSPARAALELRFEAEPEDGGPFTVVAAAKAKSPDAHPANNRVASTIDVHPGPARADLSLSLHAAPGPVTFPDDVVEAIEVANHGPTEATSVRVPMLLPLGTRVATVDGPPPTGGCYGGPELLTTTLCWDVIQPGETVHATITLGMLGTAPPTLDTAAVVTSYTADPDLADNRATTTVATQPFAAVPGVDLVARVYPPIFYDNYAAVPIGVANRGTEDGRGGHIVVIGSGPFLESGTAFIGNAEEPGPALCGEREASTTCEIVNLPSGERIAGYFAGEVTEAGQASVHVIAVAPGQDANPADNIATISFPVAPRPGPH
jgi:Domain of unknown function DUF11